MRGLRVLLGSGLAVSANLNKNFNTHAGTDILQETANLVNNVDLMEHEMISGQVPEKTITDQLRRNAIATEQVLKRVSFSPLKFVAFTGLCYS